LGGYFFVAKKKQPIFARDLTQVRKILEARSASDDRFGSLDRILPKFRAEFSPPKYTLLARKERKARNFEAAAKLEWAHCASILQRRGDIGAVRASLERLLADLGVLGNEAGIRRTQERIRRLPEILHYFGYSGY
jgi:hypothetical protein